MKVILFFLFSLFYLFSLISCTNSTGWVVNTFFKDTACLTIDSYYMNPIGVCVNIANVGSEKYVLNSDGSVSSLFCTNSTDCSSGI